MRRENDGKIISETSIIKELVSCKFTIKEVEINVNHILVDEYSLRWNYIPIEGAYIFWFKELSYNITKIDLMLLDYVKDCFINSNGKEETWEHIWICNKNDAGDTRYNGQGPKESMERRFMGSSCYKINDHGSGFTLVITSFYYTKILVWRDSVELVFS
uniref:Uncharacterized protein n=1 Tax=Rhizophagus irregularis (strain DAOM 181602 / DAOM 197198 / MUCL 43194) TaxID=747089 RepID=U9UWT6_RHIID